MSHKVNLHRIIQTPPQFVYYAFLDPHAIPNWMSSYGYTCYVEGKGMNAKVGETFHMNYKRFITNGLLHPKNGKTYSVECKFIELEPHKKIRYTANIMNASMLVGEMTVTVTLATTELSNTDITILHEGIPDIITSDMCYIAWQDSMVRLAKLVELPPAHFS